MSTIRLAPLRLSTQIACEQAMLKYLDGLSALHELWTGGLDAKLAARQGWHLRPKAHLVQHLVSDTIKIFGSPSSFWCYFDESFVGRAKKIAAMSRHPATIGKMVLKKLGILARLESMGV